MSSESPGACVAFPPFVLDLASGRLMRGDDAIHLRPRTWDVLCHLALRPGLLVTKDDLLAAVWTDAVVSEGTLTNSIRELRAALGDDARAPRFIETVHRRGFRFVARGASGDAAMPDGVAVAHVDATPTAPVPNAATSPAATPPAATLAGTAPAQVGRHAHVDALLQLAAQAAAGATRVVLLRGEAGIGKSSVVARFAAALVADASASAMRVAIGRSVGYLQGAPPWLPVLASIEALATSRDSAIVLASLATHAPDVLRQMPWLLADAAQLAPGNDTVRRDLAARLLDVLEDITRRFPVAIVLEDVHDADAPTIDFLTRLLEHAGAMRLIVIATYRPGEAVIAGNGITDAAVAVCRQPGGCAIDLDLLDASEVTEYLQRRNPSFWTREMAAAVHRRSGGNPLFMVTVADTVELTGSVRADGVPDSLRGLLDTQLRTLEFAQREMLVAASAAGVEFSSLVVSAMTGLGIDEVEATCETLARHARFLQAAGVADWPSGNVGQAYVFRHELYRNALYETLPVARRQLLHQRIGEALEGGHAGATTEIAAELADHFVRSGDHGRAIRYLREAAGLARSRFAHREALDLLDRALVLLESQAPQAAREQLEFGLQADRAASAGALCGHGSALARQTCQRVEALGERLPASFDRFFSLLVVFGLQITRSDVLAASRIAEQMTRMASELDSPIAILGATSATAMAASARGDFELADRNFRIVLEQVPREYRLPNFRDVLCPTLTVMAQNLCYLDRRDEAGEVAGEAIARADWLGDQFERASSRLAAATCAAIFGDRDGAFGLATEAAAISRDHAISETISVSEILAAWADSGAPLRERRQRATRGIEGLEATGRLFGKGFFLGLLAALEIEDGDPVAAAATLAAAREFCDSTGSHRDSAELCRVTAHVQAALGRRADRAGATVDGWLAQAEHIARRQGCALVLGRMRQQG